MFTYDPTTESTYRPGLTPVEVHENLCMAVTEMRHAERNVVLWFSEVLRRKLYRELGHASIHDYASEALGFSRSKTYQLIRLSEFLASLPALRQAVTSGVVPWTKAREIVGVATRQTEADWVEVAKSSSRRELEEKVAQSKRQAAALRASGARQRERAGQRALNLSTSVRAAAARAAPGDAQPRVEGEGAGMEGAGASTRAVSTWGATDDAQAGVGRGESAPTDDVAIEVPVTVQLRLSPLQYARLEALVDKACKLGHRESRAEMLLVGLEALVTMDTHRAKEERRKKAGRTGGVGSGRKAQRNVRGQSGKSVPDRDRYLNAPYQVVICQCEMCKQAHVPTLQGNRMVDMATLEAILCDAQISKPGARKRSTIPPSVRRKVFERDGYRCTIAGCGSTHDLIIHHEIEVSAGGTNNIDNLRTMCGPCHRWLHRKEWKKQTSASTRECTRVHKPANNGNIRRKSGKVEGRRAAARSGTGPGG